MSTNDSCHIQQTVVDIYEIVLCIRKSLAKFIFLPKLNIKKMSSDNAQAGSSGEGPSNEANQLRLNIGQGI